MSLVGDEDLPVRLNSHARWVDPVQAPCSEVAHRRAGSGLWIDPDELAQRGRAGLCVDDEDRSARLDGDAARFDPEATLAAVSEIAHDRPGAGDRVDADEQSPVVHRAGDPGGHEDLAVRLDRHRARIAPVFGPTPKSVRIVRTSSPVTGSGSAGRARPIRSSRRLDRYRRPCR